jgi:ABC-type sugar transport system substrate-binding protein
MFKRKSNAAEAASAAPATDGIMAEFSDSDSIIAAAYKVRDAGYTVVEADTHIPVHWALQSASDIVPRACPGACSCSGYWARVDCLGL